MEKMVFKELNLSDELKRGIERLGYVEATDIQSEAIIPMLQGKDIIAQAPTGTGKTCAFGIPVVEMTDKKESFVSTIVLCPTRELVIQTAKELSELSKYKKIKVAAVYGGQPIELQIKDLKKRPQIIVATPGRLMDHLRRRTVRLKDLKILVLDEADEMLNMGFREDLDVILETAPIDRQTVLFSATMPDEIIEIANKYQKDDVCKIRTTGKELTISTISQYYCEVKPVNRIEAIARIIDAKKYKLCMIFCNTKKKVDEVASELRFRKYSVDALHGDMKQMQRDRVMSRFKKGITKILVATDVAARGLDISGIDAVFNLEIPEDMEYYVHRIGRTGRANSTGNSFTFVSGKERFKIKDLSDYTKSKITLFIPPSLVEVKSVNLEKNLEEVELIISDGNLDFYKQFIKRALEKKEYSVEDLSAALLKFINEGNGNKEVDLLNDIKGIKEYRRLFINLGRLDKLGTRNMAELLKNAGVPSEDIGKIDISDKFSFVNVAATSAESAVEILNGTFYKKRKIAVEYANDKDEKNQNNKIKSFSKSNRKAAKSNNARRRNKK